MSEQTSSPGEDQVGVEGAWTLPEDDQGPITVRAAFLGVGSSWHRRHADHPDRFAAKGFRCSACRWFEVRIFRELSGRERFLIHFTGVSQVPGEVHWSRAEYVLTASEVIESLLTRKAPGGVLRQPFLTGPVARALAQASEFDDELYRAYLDRVGKVG